MSSNKITRQQRRYRNALAIHRGVRQLRIYGMAVPSTLGKLRKRKALDCGKSRCGLCSSARVLYGEPTLQERRSTEAFEYDKLMCS